RFWGLARGSHRSMLNRMMHSQSPRVTIYGFLCIMGLVASCSRGDVGAPCNHGSIDPPPSAVVTYPAKSCNDMICVYNDEAESPHDACTIGDDKSCNPDGSSTFECVENAEGSPVCRLATAYVLENSMCSKRCESDSDCTNTPGRQVLADQTSCKSDFKCAIVQSLGDFCCQKLCICAD